jgi:hypothetical protein
VPVPMVAAVIQITDIESTKGEDDEEGELVIAIEEKLFFENRSRL